MAKTATKTRKTKKNVGRPTAYSHGIADKICESLSEGLSLRKICEPATMPGKATVFRWLGKHDEFRDQYAHAREAQSHSMAEEILDIADEYSGEDADVSAPAVQVARLRVDTRKWLMSKMAPKKYGDKLTQEVSGPDGGPIMSVSPVSNDDRALARAVLDILTTAKIAEDVVEEPGRNGANGAVLPTVG